MKKYLIILILFFPIEIFAQNNYRPSNDNQLKFDSFILKNSLNFSVNQLTLFDKSNPNKNDFFKYPNEAKTGNNIKFSSLLLKKQLEQLNLSTPLNVIHNPTIERYIRVFLNKRQATLPQILDKATYYFPMFETYLDKYNLPLEIKYLAVIESALNPIATSKSGAKGLWQFMYTTGKRFGLQIDSYVDERYDILKSTDAACQYLSYLYDVFHSWDLAIAAYNSGAGNVKKAIRKSGGKTDYWEIRQYLPKETKGYLPAFYATFYLFEYADFHQLKIDKSDISYIEFGTVEINRQISFNDIKKHVSINTASLKALNPQFKKGIIPASNIKKYTLKLPLSLLNQFEEKESDIFGLNLKALIPNQDYAHIEISEQNSYIVQKGDNLVKIANKFQISLDQLKKWNGLQTNYLIEHQRLVITDKNHKTKLTRLEKNPFSPEISPIFTENESGLSKPGLKME